MAGASSRLLRRPSSYLIIAIHVFAFYYLMFAKPAFVEFKTKKIQVRTLEAKPKKAPAKKTQSAPPVAKAPAQKKPPPPSAIQKKEEPKINKQAPTTKKAEPQKQQATKESTSKKKIVKQESSQKKPVAIENKSKEKQSLAPLLSDLEEKIAKLEQNDDKVFEKSKKSPSSLDNRALYVDSLTATAEESNSSDISEDLIGFLHENLQLPDYGRVKVKMIISSSGLVKKVEILESESEQNSSYLKANLPGLRFPFFNRSFFKEPEKSYVVNFCNEL